VETVREKVSRIVPHLQDRCNLFALISRDFGEGIRLSPNELSCNFLHLSVSCVALIFFDALVRGVLVVSQVASEVF
jgi:hypothetical protein